MPFTTLETVQPFLENGIYLALAETLGAGDYFDVISVQVDYFVRDYTGRPIPASVAEAPDWMTYPYAKILQKFSAHLLTAPEPELIKMIDQDYQEALKTLQAHPYAAESGGDDLPDKSSSFNGSITGSLSW